MESSISLLNKLGEGSYGEVYKVKVDQEYFALKIFQEQDIIPPWELEILSREIPGNLYSIERLIYKGCLALLLPLASCDLAQYLKRDLSKETRISLANQACYALVQLHSHGYYHLDIKPENFLIFEDSLCLADYSVSRGYQVKEIREEVVTVPYRPPELFVGKKTVLNEKIDNWSLALVLIEILTGEKITIRRRQDISSFYARKKKILAKVPSPEHVNLLSLLFEINPLKRGSIRELYNKPLLFEESKVIYSPLTDLEEFFSPLTQELSKEGTWRNFAQVITLFSLLKEKNLDKLFLLVKLVLLLDEIYIDTPINPRLELDISIELETFHPSELKIPYPHLLEKGLDRKISSS